MSKRERTRVRCKMDELPDDVRVQAEAMLLDSAISYAEISQTLAQAGYEISKSSVARYAQRTGREQQRIKYIRDRADAILAAYGEHRGLEVSDVTHALVMDNLIQALADASIEDYAEIPTAKLAELALKSQRNEIYRARMMRSYARDVEQVRQAMLAELAQTVQGTPELMAQLEAASRDAAQKVVDSIDRPQ